MSGGYRAGEAHYRGDMRSIVGEVKGPTTFGTLLLASAAEYDEAADRTTVEFVTLERGLDPVRYDSERRSLVPGILLAADR